MMFNDIVVYLEANDLIINRKKTRYVIFNRGKGPPQTDRVYHNKKEVVRVSSFKYLGVTLKQDLTYDDHTEETGRRAKKAVGATWRTIMSNNEVCETTKRKIFESAIKTIGLYGAEIWGGTYYECVEGIKSHFIKRSLKMPTYTPNYMMVTEMGENPLYAETLKTKYKYNLKIRNHYEQSRLTRRVAEELDRSNLGIYANMERSCLEMGLESGNMTEDIQGLMDFHVDWVAKRYREDMCREARNSLSRQLYPCLGFLPAYMRSTRLTGVDKGNMWKIRADLTGMGWVPYIETVESCRYCGKEIRPDSRHIFAECEFLKLERMSVTGKEMLGLGEFRKMLNGDGDSIINLYNLARSKMENL